MSGFGPVTPVSQDAVDELKDYLRITDATQDDHLALLLAASQAWAEGYLGTPLASVERTEQVGVARNETYLRTAAAPIDADEDITITDPDGDSYDVGYFTLNAPAGLLVTGGTLAGRTLLDPGTWTVTYTGGLAAREDYTRVVEPQVSHAIMLVAADWYANRNPRASSENDGDTSTVLTSTFGAGRGMPPWAVALLTPYRRL